MGVNLCTIKGYSFRPEKIANIFRGDAFLLQNTLDVYFDNQQPEERRINAISAYIRFLENRSVLEKSSSDNFQLETVLKAVNGRIGVVKGKSL